MQNTPITRLVTGLSDGQRRENLDEPGFVKASDSGSVPVTKRPPSLKPAHPGFLLSASTPQSGLANGPTWAALKKHRHCVRPQARRPAFLSGTGQDWGPTVETSPFRLNDDLKGLWVAGQDSASGRGVESLGFHPCQTYGQIKTGVWND